MNAKVLSDDVINLVGQIASIQTRKAELQERIRLYENKLDMVRNASLSLANEEQELANQLQSLGFTYGQTSAQDFKHKHINQDQLASLLNTLYQSNSPKISKRNGAYNFSGNSSPVRMIPKISPTSAPNRR